MSQGLSQKKIIIDWKWQRIQILMILFEVHFLWRSPVLNFWVKQGKSFIQISPKVKFSAGWSSLFIGAICKQSWKIRYCMFSRRLHLTFSYKQKFPTNESCMALKNVRSNIPKRIIVSDNHLLKKNWSALTENYST